MTKDRRATQSDLQARVPRRLSRTTVSSPVTPPKLPISVEPAGQGRKKSLSGARKKAVPKRQAQALALAAMARDAIGVSFEFYDGLNKRNKAAAKRPYQELVPLAYGTSVWTTLIAVLCLCTSLGVALSFLVASGGGLS